MNLKVDCDPSFTGDDCTKVQFASCSELPSGSLSKVYTFTNRNTGTNFDAYCDMVTVSNGNVGGWTVIQTRNNGAEDFDKPWQSYVEGFGAVSKNGASPARPNGNFWIGLDNLASLATANQQLRIEYDTCDGRQLVTEYGQFRVGP